MEKEINRECTQLCSKKNPSILRMTSKDSILTFTFEKLSGELSKRAPLFHSLLVAACTNPRSKATEPQNEFASVAMAGAVCLRSRSKFMIAAQLLITIFLYHANWLVSHGLLLYPTNFLRLNRMILLINWNPWQWRHGGGGGRGGRCMAHCFKGVPKSSWSAKIAKKD